MRKILLTLALALAAVSLGLSDARACGAGDKAQVLWKGTWYPATVLKAKGAECFIHYDGYGSNWDEWVGPDRIKVTSSGASAPAAAASFSEGDPVSVLWKGTWYPAHVLKVLGGDRYRIHYDGYDNSWDENVGPSRIRAR
jgi:RNA binding chromodomain-containing protein/agenet domain-containing protein